MTTKRFLSEIVYKVAVKQKTKIAHPQISDIELGNLHLLRSYIVFIFSTLLAAQLEMNFFFTNIVKDCKYLRNAFSGDFLGSASSVCHQRTNKEINQISAWELWENILLDKCEICSLTFGFVFAWEGISIDMTLEKFLWRRSHDAGCLDAVAAVLQVMKIVGSWRVG